MIEQFYISQGSSPYSAKAQAVINRMSGLTTSQKDAIAAFVDNLDATGDYDYIKDFWMFKGLGSEANSLKGWKGSLGSTDGSPTWNNSIGFSFDTTNYVDTGYNPDTHGDTVTSQLISLGVGDNRITSGSSPYLFGSTGGASEFTGLIDESAGSIKLNWGGDSLTVAATNTASNKRYTGKGTASDLEILDGTISLGTKGSAPTGGNGFANVNYSIAYASSIVSKADIDAEMFLVANPAISLSNFLTELDTLETSLGV